MELLIIFDMFCFAAYTFFHKLCQTDHFGDILFGSPLRGKGGNSGLQNPSGFRQALNGLALVLCKAEPKGIVDLAGVFGDIGTASPFSDDDVSRLQKRNG